MKGTLLGIPFFAPPSAPLAKVCLWETSMTMTAHPACAPQLRHPGELRRGDSQSQHPARLSGGKPEHHQPRHDNRYFVQPPERSDECTSGSRTRGFERQSIPREEL